MEWKWITTSFINITGEKPEKGKVKCNTDGACRGNPGDSSYGFCLRNDVGNLIYAEAKRIGHGANIQAEALAILNALRYCKNNSIVKALIESDSLTLTKMIRKEWRVSWQQAEIIEEVQGLLITQFNIKRVFRDSNKLADKIANEAFNYENAMQIQNYNHLSAECKIILEEEKTQGWRSRVTMTIIKSISIATQLRQREIQRYKIKNKKDKDKKGGKDLTGYSYPRSHTPLSIPPRNPQHPPGYNSTEKE
ncbi:hypothetical protein KY284_011371 [Solanum tuberosum]|nr:hypothetical protein KY284_011371 [Solanum tuberosum]